MDDELRMLLADYGSPEKLADCIVKNFKGWCVPAPLAEIAAAVGISELIKSDSQAFEGILVTDPGKTAGSIAYNATSRHQRQRFTIAHEIGHFLIPTHGQNAQCVKSDFSVVQGKNGQHSKEAEANRFASSLLMPADLFKRSMRKLGSAETDHIVKLAVEFDVSKEAAARRFVGFAEEPCAFIFSKDRKVLNTYRSADFPFIPLSKGSALPAKARTARAIGEPGVMSEWEEMPADTWLEPTARIRGRKLHEQALQQIDGYALTMLSLDDADEDSDYGEESRGWSGRSYR